MTKILIVKVGEAFPALRSKRNDFEDWVMTGMQINSDSVAVVDVRAGEPLPGYEEVAGVVITGSHAMVTEHHAWSERTAAWLPGAVERQIPTLGIYLFGTDDLGRDVFARMLQGAWVSLTVGFVAVGISVLVGIFMGGIAGFFGQGRVCVYHIIMTFTLVPGAVLLVMGETYWGVLLVIIGLLSMAGAVFSRTAGPTQHLTGWLHQGTLSIDTLIMRMVDIMLCFPSFFLILTVVALLPASMYNIMIVIGLTSWMGTTRFVRAEFLSLREQDFVTAAKALGIGNLRIIFRHMMPNAVAPVLVSATIGIATAILTEAGLSFLGFGVPPPHATWGNILSDGKRFIFDAPWLTFIPGIAILIVVLCFNLFGEGLRDALNPKLRERG